MKANPTEQEPVTFALEPDTMGCVIGCLPYIIRERAYQLFKARGGSQVMNWTIGYRPSGKSSTTLAFEITRQKTKRI